MREWTKKLLTRFEDAVRANDRQGGGDPADIPAIELEYNRAKQALYYRIESLESSVDRASRLQFPDITGS